MINIDILATKTDAIIFEIQIAYVSNLTHACGPWCAPVRVFDCVCVCVCVFVCERERE
jgi:hypothetical protein